MQRKRRAQDGASPLIWVFDDTRRDDDMHSSRRFSWLLPWVVLTAVSASAQEAVSPLPGTRLRVTAPPVTAKPIVGSLVQITEREIILAVSASDRTIVPRANIERVEWSKGRHGHPIKGLLIGAAIGAVVLPVAICAGETCGEGEIPVGALVGAGLGALPGVGIGALVKTERWAELPVGNLRVTAEAIPKRGFGLKLTWAW
jgi:hypothetical protein